MGTSKTKLSKLLGISRPTLDLFLKGEYKLSEKQKAIYDNYIKNYSNEKVNELVRISDIKVSDIENILEFLQDNNFLNVEGLSMRHTFWSNFVKVK